MTPTMSTQLWPVFPQPVRIFFRCYLTEKYSDCRSLAISGNGWEWLPFPSECFPRASPDVSYGREMAKLTKRFIDGLRSKPTADVFAWDGELRGFGVRIKPSGAGAYLIQYRTAQGRT